MLSNIQKVDCAETSASLFNKNPNNFISRFVTVYETWLHHFDPKSKAQSMAWKHITSPPPRFRSRDIVSLQSYGHCIL